MGTFRSDLPLGTTDIKVLLGNASNFDEAMHEKILRYWFDRFARQRLTWHGMEELFQEFLINSGYQGMGEYVAGLELTARNQMFRKDGELYRASAALDLPYTLTGDWTQEQGLFVAMGDQALRQDLGNKTNPSLGAGVIGFSGRLLSEYLNQQEYYLTIEHFGPTDTPQDAFNTIQAAINFCAKNGVLLRAKRREYIVDYSADSHMIPDYFRCELGGAVIKRATGNKTPHDMWRNADFENGNIGLSIKSVSFDGQYDVDNLDVHTASHRFCGLRLRKSSGVVEDVKARKTVNGEHQPEGIRGGVVFEVCDIRASRVDTEDIYGSGVLIRGGKGSLIDCRFKNSWGSGLTGDQPGWFLHNLSSDGSGYSGISINGPRVQASKIRSKNTGPGYAGVNFGHNGTLAGNPDIPLSVDYAQISDVYAEDCESWGVNITNATLATFDAIRANRSGDAGVRVRNSNSCRFDIAIATTTQFGLVLDNVGGVNEILLRSDAVPSEALRIENAPVGATYIMSDESVVVGGVYGVRLRSGTPFTKARGVFVGQTNSIVMADAGAVSLSDIVIAGGNVKPFNPSTGVAFLDGNIRRAGANSTGNFNISSGNSATINNANSFDVNRIIIRPLNSAARAAGVVTITAIELGESFSVTTQNSISGSADFSYSMM